MKKYRVRLKSERVVGPFEKKEIIELYQKFRIDGDEDIQYFPTGDWSTFSNFVELRDILDLEREEPLDATFIKKINLEDLKSESLKEEKIEKDTVLKKFEYEKKTPFTSRDEIELDQDQDNIEMEDPLDSYESEDTIEKTNVSNIDISMKEAAEDKTVISSNTLDYLEELRAQKESDELKSEKTEEESIPEVDLDNDSTQFLDISNLKESINGDLKKIEKELKIEKREFDKEIQSQQKAVVQRESEAEDDDEVDEDPAKRRKKIIIAIAFIAIFYVLLFPEEETDINKPKPVVLKSPEISFPIRYETDDEALATSLYKKALLLEREGTYVAEMNASVALRNSLVNKFNGNKAAAKMIFLYSHLLINSDDRESDANTIFKLVQIFKARTLLDPGYASAIALFYLNTGKSNAAVKTVEKYLTVKKSKPSVELFSVYLRSLVATGDLITAKKAAKKIESVSVDKMNLFTVLSLVEYYKVLGNFDKIAQIVETSSKKYNKSVSLSLIKADLYFYKEDFKSLEVLLKDIRLKNLGGSKVFYSKYLEYMGLVSVKKGKVKKAEKYFQKALEIHENLDLRSRLSSLFDTESTEQNKMIVESKSLQLIASSKLQASKNNWKFAFKDALEATRIAENFIPAKLHLAQLQIKQSIFDEAIKTLEILYKNNSQNPQIIFTLIDAYIESYKFTNVRKLLTLLNSSELRNRPEYTSLSAKYYMYKNDFRNSVAWLLKAINKNPLNDTNRYLLSKVLIKYNKFDRAKSNLNKAMDLDPAKIEYRVEYSNILYEIDGSDSAIGYLYDILTDFPDNPKLLSQIGIFYYRSGQLKSFENIKKKLQSLPTKDTTLYEFLIKAARLDDKDSDEIKYSRKLIELNPGDLRTRLSLGKLFMSQERYKEALIEFKAIEDRLDTYPNLQLYMSKLYLLTDNKDKAIELANKEVKANASSEFGYILLGEIYSAKKEYLEAEKYFKKAQKINGDNVDMLLGIAKISFKKSQYDLTIDLFLKARENAPERAEIHKLLGDTYRKTGQSSLGIESYKLFLELSPTSKYKDEIETYIRKMQ
jgi:tetratricopeptide (TPR) repeat protein